MGTEVMKKGPRRRTVLRLSPETVAIYHHLRSSRPPPSFPPPYPYDLLRALAQYLLGYHQALDTRTQARLQRALNEAVAGQPPDLRTALFGTLWAFGQGEEGPTVEVMKRLARAKRILAWWEGGRKPRWLAKDELHLPRTSGRS